MRRLVLFSVVTAFTVGAAPLPPGSYVLEPGGQYTFSVPGVPPTTYVLTTTATGTGSGIVTGAGTYAAGATVSLTATAATGSTFVGWSPAPCASSFAMPAAPLTCTATFSANAPPPPPAPASGAQWKLLNPGFVPDGQFTSQGELGAAFDPIRNRVFVFDWHGGAWVYEFVGAGQASIRELNNGQRPRGQSRNCAFAYVPPVDAVVTINCGSSANAPDGFPVYRFPDLNTVTTSYQCVTPCNGPQTANFLAWNPSRNELVGGGGWGASQDSILTYSLPGGAFPSAETPWKGLPQTGVAPGHAACDICKEAMRRTVLRNGNWVYVDPLTHDLYTFDFATTTWTVTATNKPGALPVNGVVGYDPAYDELVIWVGTDALYGSGPATRQTWIYSFASNQWKLGPNHAAGDVNPGVSLAVASFFVWDSNLNRLVLITTDGVGGGYTRLWAFNRPSRVSHTQTSN